MTTLLATIGAFLAGYFTQTIIDRLWPRWDKRLLELGRIPARDIADASAGVDRYKGKHFWDARITPITSTDLEQAFQEAAERVDEHLKAPAAPTPVVFEGALQKALSETAWKWIEAHTDEYRDRWVALYGDKLLASAATLAELKPQLGNYPLGSLVHHVRGREVRGKL